MDIVDAMAKEETDDYLLYVRTVQIGKVRNVGYYIYVYETVGLVYGISTKTV